MIIALAHRKLLLPLSHFTLAQALRHTLTIIKGGELLAYKANKQKAKPGCNAAEAIDTNVEDRNRTAPFPFCGNRFEFRAVGSSQNCSFPVMICNTIMAAGMAQLSDLMEKGMKHRDAVAQMYKENMHVIFTGNGYSAEWPIEAKKRGLPNLNDTPKAIAAWASNKNRTAFEKMGIYTPEETEARAEVMYEAYITTLAVEAETMVSMVETGIIPACAKDLAKYAQTPKLQEGRSELYESIIGEKQKLKK